MARRKKKQDKLIAGFLALLTAFSPVASVVPVYAADLNDTGSSSITMDPDSITIDETGSDGIVLDESTEGSDGISVIDDGESEGSISIDDNQNGDDIQIDNVDSDGIDIGETGSDGINIDNVDDGIDIDESDDGITINDIGVGDTIDGVTIDSITKAGDGIIIESTDEDGNKSFIADPWGGELPKNAVNVSTMYELSVDIRSVHGFVKLTPVGSDESDLSQVKYIRIVESDGEYVIVVTDGNDNPGNDNPLYTASYDDAYGVAWSEFIAPDAAYIIEAVADEGYVVTDYSIVSPRNKDEIADFNDFVSGYQSYSWTLGNLIHDRSVIVNFGSVDGIDFDTDIGIDVDESHDLADTSDVIMSVDMMDDSAIESSDENESDETEPVQSILESEKDTLGYENIEIIPSMVGDVDVPKITNADRKEAICDPVYEGYIRDNINSEYVDFQDLMPAGNMLVKQTFFDGERLNGRTTIDEVMFSDEEDKLETVVTQMDTMIPVYDVGDSNYYVAYVDTMHNDSRSYVIDHQFAYNNLYGQVLDDCIYDYDTGIAYINKDYFVDENNDFVLNHVQVQLGQVINYNPQYTESVVLDGMDDDINVESFDVFVGECSFEVDKGLDSNNMNVWMNGGPCLYDYEYDPVTGVLTLQVSAALVNSVYVEDTRSFGQSILNAIFPFTVAKAAAGLDTPGAKVEPDDMANLGQVVLKKKYNGKAITDVEVGDGGRETGTYTYHSPGYKNYADSNYPYKCYCFQWGSLGNDPISKSWANWIKSGGKNDRPNITIQENVGQGLFFSLKMDTLTANNLPFKWDNLLSGYDSLILPLQCTHVGQHATGVNSTTHLTKKGNVWCRVIKRWKKTPGDKKTFFLLGIMTGTMNTQTGLGLIKLCYVPDDEPVNVKLRIQKVFNNRFGEFDVKVYDDDAEDAEEAAAYDLTSSLFGIYKTRSQAEKAPVMDTTGKTKADLDKVGDNGLLKILKVKNGEGETGTWKLHKENVNDNFWLDNDDNKIPNKIYIVELKAGNGYSLPTMTMNEWTDGSFDANLNLSTLNRIVTIDLDSYYDRCQAINDDTFTISYANSPLNDPGVLTLFKTTNPDPAITEISDWKEKCSDSRMNGAKFKLEYWNVDLKKYDKDINTAISMIVNGYTDDIGKPDENDPVVDSPQYNEIPARKPDCEVVLKTVNHPKYGDGFVSLQYGACYVSGEWKWKLAAGTQCVMPLGLYRLTEIEPPKGYRLPSQTTFFGYCKTVDSKNWNNEDEFRAKFDWLDIGGDEISVSQMRINYGGDHDYFNYEFNPSLFKEESPYLNIGTLKIDKSTGKPGAPDNDVLSLAGIEFGIWLDEDNSDPVKNPITGKNVNPGEQFEGVTLVTDENGCADTVGFNINDEGLDFGVLTPGCKYVIKEIKSNNSFFKNSAEFKFEIPSDISSDLYPEDGSPICFFPTKDGDVLSHEDISSAKDAYNDYSANKNDKSKWKLDYNKITIFENEPPNIGVGVQKFDIMLDSSVRGVNGIANHGNATLEGHTFVVINGTKSDVRLNDSKKLDGKGTIVNSIWNFIEPGVLKHPYNPSYEELYNCIVDTNSVLKDDGTREWFVVDNAKSGPTYGKKDDKDDKNKNTDDVDKTRGYVCAVLTTNKDGYAETLKDLLPMGVYYVIEVDTKVTKEGYHDYLVNTLDVGHVGEYQSDGTDEDGNQKDKLVLEKSNGEAANASNMGPDGEVFVAEFTQKLKDTEWKDVNKTHSDKKEAANKPPRGGVRFQKYNWNSDDPYATGDADLSGAHFAIINVSNELVQNKDGVNIPTWKGVGAYQSKDSFATLKWSDVNAAVGTYKVQEVVTKLVDDPTNRFGAGTKVNLGETGDHDLPYGDYLLIETQSPDGYYLNKEWVGYFEIREDGEIVEIQTVTGDDHNMDAERWRGYNNLPMKYERDAIACRDKPYGMGIAIEKLDYEMKRPIAQGTASLKGAVYAVINASDHAIARDDGVQISTIQSLSDYSNDAVSYKYLYDIYKNDQRYAGSGGHVVTTFETDKRGFASTEKDALPAGTYYVIEVKASPGYWIDENFVGKVCVRDDNICMAMTDKNNPTKNGSYLDFIISSKIFLFDIFLTFI